MNIIVTGASKGIGFECCKLLTLNQSNHVWAISRDTKSLADLKRPNLQLVSFDLGKSDYEELNQKINPLDGKIDVLINNAGVLIYKPFEELSALDFETSFAVNVIAPARLIQFSLPFLKASGVAHVVNITSMGGFQGSVKFAGLAAYSASKAALANLTELLSEELSPYSIKVNCLALGAVQTEMLSQVFPNYKAPLSANEMAQYIADFALNGHRFYNGKVLPVALTTP